MELIICFDDHQESVSYTDTCGVSFVLDTTKSAQEAAKVDCFRNY